MEPLRHICPRRLTKQVTMSMEYITSYVNFDSCPAIVSIWKCVDRLRGVENQGSACSRGLVRAASLAEWHDSTSHHLTSQCYACLLRSTHHRVQCRIVHIRLLHTLYSLLNPLGGQGKYGRRAKLGNWLDGGQRLLPVLGVWVDSAERWSASDGQRSVSIKQTGVMQLSTFQLSTDNRPGWG